MDNKVIGRIMISIEGRQTTYPRSLPDDSSPTTDSSGDTPYYSVNTPLTGDLGEPIRVCGPRPSDFTKRCVAVSVDQ